MDVERFLVNTATQIERINKEIAAGKRLGNNIIKLKAKKEFLVECYENIQRNLQHVKKLKPRTYYSVAVSHRSSNPKHGAILYVGFDYNIQIYNHSYDGQVDKMHISKLYYFEVLRELKELKNIVDN